MNHLTQSRCSLIKLTPKPALRQVDMTLRTEEHGQVIICFDEFSLERYTPWGNPSKGVVHVPHFLFFFLLVLSVGSLVGLIMALTK